MAGSREAASVGQIRKSPQPRLDAEKNSKNDNNEKLTK